MSPDTLTLRRTLSAGLLAPSADNRHHLRFEFDGAALRLHSTDAASWAAQPHRKFLALLACGAVVENMVLRAAELGHAMTLDGPPGEEAPGCVARLHWTPTRTPPDPLGRCIEVRHTNRRFYRRAALPKFVLVELAAAAAAVAGAELRWLDEPSARALALQAIRVAETERFRRRALHAELFDAVRFDVGWQHTATEGLPPAALEVEWPMRLPFALLRHWCVMRLAIALGAHRALGWRAGALPCALAPHLGLLVMRDEASDRATLQGGRAFQRLWLAATAAGLALQPLAAATTLLQQRAGDGWVDAATQARLRTLLSKIGGGAERRPLMLFRLGEAAPPSAVAGRRPLADYLASDYLA